MIEVTCYKTTDGRLFEFKDDAGSHEYELKLRDALTITVGKFFSHHMTEGEIVDCLYNARFELAKVYNFCAPPNEG